VVASVNRTCDVSHYPCSLIYKENVYMIIAHTISIRKTFFYIYLIMFLNYITYLGIHTYSNFDFDFLLIPFLSVLPKIRSNSVHFKNSIMNILDPYEVICARKICGYGAHFFTFSAACRVGDNSGREPMEMFCHHDQSIIRVYLHHKYFFS